MRHLLKMLERFSTGALRARRAASWGWTQDARRGGQGGEAV